MLNGCLFLIEIAYMYQSEINDAFMSSDVRIRSQC